MAFDTDGDLVDITMTKDQAEELGSKLLKAAVSSSKCNWAGQQSKTPQGPRSSGQNDA